MPPVWTDVTSTSVSLTTKNTCSGLPARRAVNVACVAGVDGAAVKLAADEDIVYSPDQPDYVFDQGLTVAAWINPDRITGTQSIIRKRFDNSSSFVLGIDGKRLVFALKLANGKTVGISAGGLAAGTFTHVAATYDGSDAILYIGGAVDKRPKSMPWYRDIDGYIQNYVTNVTIGGDPYELSSPQSAGSGRRRSAQPFRRRATS